MKDLVSISKVFDSAVTGNRDDQLNVRIVIVDRSNAVPI